MTTTTIQPPISLNTVQRDWVVKMGAILNLNVGALGSSDSLSIDQSATSARRKDDNSNSDGDTTSEVVMILTANSDPAKPETEGSPILEGAQFTQMAGPAPTRAQGTVNPKGKVYRFRMGITEKMVGLSADDFLVLVVAQRYRISTDEAKARAKKEGWKFTPFIPVKKEEIGKYRLIEISGDSQGTDEDDEVAKLEKAMDDFAKLFHQLSKEDQRMIEVYMNKMGLPLKKGPAKDDGMMPEWLKTGLELVKQRLAIAALDQEMFRFMVRHSNTSLPLSPELYGKFLETAAELQSLKRYKATWKDFANQVTVQAKDFDDFKYQVQNYAIHLSSKENTKALRIEAKDKLAGKDKLFAAYKDLQKAKKEELRIKLIGDPVVAEREITRTEAEYRKLLTAYGYKDAAAFESEMDSYVKTFEREATIVAKDMLDGGEHQLQLQEQALTDEKLKALFKNLAKARTALANLPEPDATQMAAKLQFDRAKYLSTRTEDLKPVVSAINALVDSDPLLQDLKGRDGYPFTLVLHVDLAEASNERELRGVLLDSITAKRDSIRLTRKYLEKDPRLIWSLDDLQKQTKLQTGVDSDSLYAGILADKQSKDAEDEKWNTIKKTILAVVLGALSFGTGAVAMGAGAIAAGIGFDEGMDALRKYEIQSNAHGAGLLSTDPSFGWVLLAFAGVGLDALGVGAAAKAGAKAAQAARMKRTVELLQEGTPVGNAVRAFNKADDRVAALEKLGQDLQAADAKLRDAIMRSAKAEAQADAALKAANKVAFGKAGGSMGPLALIAQQAPYYVYATVLLIRQQIAEFSQFIKMRRVVTLIGRIENLGPDALKALRKEYDLAVKQGKEIVKRGQELKLTDEAWEDALAMWAHKPEMTADEFLRVLPEYGPRNPTQAMGTVHNTGNTKAIAAPKSVMDDNSRRVLRGHDAPSMSEDIAGTGGIQKIKAVKDPDGTTRVQIGGEILPHKLRRAKKKKVTQNGREVEVEIPLKPGQKDAPNFNGSDKLAKLTELGLRDGEWARLHLWGPGFGDEAAAGMFVGPTAMNLKWQNSGIEDKLRQLADRIAPLRPNHSMKVIATAESWGRTTPKGFALPNGEPLAKSFTYEIIVTTPAGSRSATVKLELSTDPYDIVRGAKPEVSLSMDDSVLHQLFEEINPNFTGPRNR